jgi:hypothetical protein
MSTKKIKTDVPVQKKKRKPIKHVLLRRNAKTGTAVFLCCGTAKYCAARLRDVIVAKEQKDGRPAYSYRFGDLFYRVVSEAEGRRYV